MDERGGSLRVSNLMADHVYKIKLLFCILFNSLRFILFNFLLKPSKELDVVGN